MSDRLIILPPRGRIVVAPADTQDRPVPRVELPEDVSLPPVFVPKLGPVTPGTLVDIRANLPREPRNRPAGGKTNKESITAHWLGYNHSRSASDAEAVAELTRIAYSHIRRDFGSGSGGETIMYHEAIAPTGTIFILREHDEIAWHSGNDRGNRTSRAILVMCGPDTPPTAAQLDVARNRFPAFKVPMFGHQDWSPTQCPGPVLMELVRSLRA